MKSVFPSDSIDIKNHEHQSKLPRHINCHYNSIKSKFSRHRKFENSPDEIPSNRRQIKQHRNEFIRKWTDDARNIYAQHHLIPSSNQMTYIDSKKADRKFTPDRSTSSSILNKSDTSSTSANELYNNKPKDQSSNSISLSSIRNIKQKNSSSNNSAIVYLKSQKSNDNLECKIS
jgi:hypothetical protein